MITLFQSSVATLTNHHFQQEHVQRNEWKASKPARLGSLTFLLNENIYLFEFQLPEDFMYTFKILMFSPNNDYIYKYYNYHEQLTDGWEIKAI